MTPLPPAPPTDQVPVIPKPSTEQQTTPPSEDSGAIGVTSAHSVGSEVISPIESFPEVGVSAGTVGQSIELSELRVSNANTRLQGVEEPIPGSDRQGQDATRVSLG